MTRDRDVGKRFDRLIEDRTDRGRRIGSTVGATSAITGLGLGMLHGKDDTQGNDRGMHLRGGDPFHLGHDTTAGRDGRLLGGGMGEAIRDLEASGRKGRRVRLGEGDWRPLAHRSGSSKKRQFRRSPRQSHL